MFKIVDEPTFSRRATAYVPTTSGTVEAQDFELSFTLVEDWELREIEHQVLEQTGDAVAAHKASLRRIIIGWSDVARPGGGELGYSEAALDAALRAPWFRAAAVRAYNAAISAGAAEGN